MCILIFNLGKNECTAPLLLPFYERQLLPESYCILCYAHRVLVVCCLLGNKQDTNKLTLLAFKIIAILRNTLLASFIMLLETVNKGLLRNSS